MASRISAIKLSEAQEDADRLREQYRSGSPLALFQCLALWKERGLPSIQLPPWVIEALINIGAEWYVQYEDWAVNRRNPNPPSLDVLAGLQSDGPGHQSAHRRVSKREVEQTAVDYFKAVVDEALRVEAGGEPPLPNKRPSYYRRIKIVAVRKGRALRFVPNSDALPIRILNDRHQPTEEFQEAIARLFKLGGVRTFQRILRDRRLADK